jgi:hypothetical protein
MKLQRCCQRDACDRGIWWAIKIESRSPAVDKKTRKIAYAKQLQDRSRAQLL